MTEGTSGQAGIFLGSVTISSKGQVVIPQRVREMYGLQTGDQLIVLGNPEQAGFALLKPAGFLQIQQQLAGLAAQVTESAASLPTPEEGRAATDVDGSSTAGATGAGRKSGKGSKSRKTARPGKRA